MTNHEPARTGAEGPPRDFGRLFGVLNGQGVSYYVFDDGSEHTGLVVEHSPENLERLAAAMGELNARLRDHDGNLLSVPFDGPTLMNLATWMNLAIWSSDAGSFEILPGLLADNGHVAPFWDLRDHPNHRVAVLSGPDAEPELPFDWVKVDSPVGHFARPARDHYELRRLAEAFSKQAVWYVMFDDGAADAGVVVAQDLWNLDRVARAMHALNARLRTPDGLLPVALDGPVLMDIAAWKTRVTWSSDAGGIEILPGLVADDGRLAPYWELFRHPARTAAVLRQGKNPLVVPAITTTSPDARFARPSSASARRVVRSPRAVTSPHNRWPPTPGGGPVPEH